MTVISFVMLAIGTRAHAPCCASTSPVAGFSTMNARAKTGGGDVGAACAAVTKASAARTAAAQIRRITSGKASVEAQGSLDADALSDVHRRRIDAGIQGHQLVHRGAVLPGDGAERVAA